jgi:hypothetical protein
MNRYSIALGKNPSPPSEVIEPRSKPRIQQKARLDRYGIALGKDPPPVPPGVVEDNYRPTNTSQDHAELLAIAQSPSGRLQLADAMAINVRQRLNSLSIARRCLISDLSYRVENNLPSGVPSIYDISGTSLMYAEDGLSILRIGNGTRRVVVPIFEINSIVPIKAQSLRDTPDIFDKIINQASSDLATKEGSRFISLLDYEAGSSISTVFLEPSELGHAFTEIEKNGLRVGHILINPAHNSTVRGWGICELATNRELIVAGILGTAYGAQISHSLLVPAESVFVIAEPAQLGCLQDVMVGISADDSYARESNFIFYERLGMGLLNTKAVVRINILPF